MVSWPAIFGFLDCLFMIIFQLVHHFLHLLIVWGPGKLICFLSKGKPWKSLLPHSCLFHGISTRSHDHVGKVSTSSKRNVLLITEVILLFEKEKPLVFILVLLKLFDNLKVLFLKSL